MTHTLLDYITQETLATNEQSRDGPKKTLQTNPMHLSPVFGWPPRATLDCNSGFVRWFLSFCGPLATRRDLVGITPFKDKVSARGNERATDRPTPRGEREGEGNDRGGRLDGRPSVRPRLYYTYTRTDAASQGKAAERVPITRTVGCFCCLLPSPPSLPSPPLSLPLSFLPSFPPSLHVSCGRAEVVIKESQR